MSIDSLPGRRRTTADRRRNGPSAVRLQAHAADDDPCTAVLDALPAMIAVLDPLGEVVAVNQGWRQSTARHALCAPVIGPQMNYLAICDQADGGAGSTCRRAATGIRAVLDGSLPLFCLDYEGGSPGSPRALRMKVTALGARRVPGAVVMHTEIGDTGQPDTDPATAHLARLSDSRQAGMAEVASSVLHNVGNVLNSVNISTGVAIEIVKNSKTHSLARVVRLLEDHADDLGTFLARDPKGRQVPGFLVKLVERLQQEQATTLHELELLRRHVDHIKQIVSTQQSLAKVSGLSEVLRVEGLVEDALRMAADALVRHDVEVVREFSAVPAIEVDKHKAVQILVNLIRNAKFACIESGRRNKRVTLRIVPVSAGVCITVGDNGVGIAAENLVRIFRHGFTTRKDGHGFGLHSGALAARELGGTLQASSEGPGRGATFNLVLPLRAPGARA